MCVKFVVSYSLFQLNFKSGVGIQKIIFFFINNFLMPDVNVKLQKEINII